MRRALLPLLFLLVGCGPWVHYIDDDDDSSLDGATLTFLSPESGDTVVAGEAFAVTVWVQGARPAALQVEDTVLTPDPDSAGTRFRGELTIEQVGSKVLRAWFQSLDAGIVEQELSIQVVAAPTAE